jgi:ABC-type transport system involved in cytochrome bd biosynthesis fused ATPase/permease subunit
VLDAVLATGPWSGRRTGDVVAKATEGIEAVGGLAATFLPNLIGGMTIPLLLGLVVATIDIPTAIALVLVLPLIPLMLRILERRFASVSTRYRATADVLAARFLDGIQGLRTLKVLDQADRYGDDLAAESERLRVETMRLLRVNQLALLAVDSLFTLGTVVAAAGMAAWRLSADAITVGEAVALVLLGVMLIEPLSQIGRFFYVGAIGRAAAGQVRELMGLATTTPQRSRAGIGDIGEGTVEFEHVSFAYPDGEAAVVNVSFSITPGEQVALVGPSGAGKTTIAHMVLGLLLPDQGEVRVGGPAVLVPQRPFLFHGSVANNLRLAKPDATDQEMLEALRAADLDGLISNHPEGLAIPVGERGLSMSGGEVQRLAIARALLVDAPVVVLDEPTSNVDLGTEARIRHALDRLTAGKTVIIIAHRRSTIRGADRVIMLDEGRLVDSRVTDGAASTPDPNQAPRRRP